ncbi:MAG: histidine kinase [Mariniphaga sp.]
MLKKTIVFFLTALQLIAYSQTKQNIDSLLVLVQQSRNDSVSASFYLQISKEYWSDDPVKCKENATAALLISKKINSHNLMYNAYRNMGHASSLLGQMSDALCYDRLCFREAVLSGDDKKVMAGSLNFGNDLIYFSKFDSANRILDTGIRIAKKYNDKEQLCLLYINKGNNLYYSTTDDSYEKYYREGLKLSIAIGDTESMVMLYNNIAAIRLQRGVADSVVINYTMKAIAINEQRKNYLNLGDCYATLASAYNTHSQNEKAIFYLKKGLRAFALAKNEAKSINLLASIADQFRELKRYDSATFYINLAIERAGKNHDKHGLACGYSIKGQLLSETLNYELAELYLQKAFLIFSEGKDKDIEGILLSGNYLADALLKQKKFKEAIPVATNVFKLADTLKNYQAVMKSAFTLSEIFHKLGTDAKAYEFLKLYMAAADTIRNDKNKRLLEEMGTKYETQIKDNKILKLQNDNLIQDKKIIQQSKKILIIVAVAILLLSVFFFYVKQTKYRNEKEQYLLKQKALELSRQVSENDMKALRSQMNPHFVFNCVHTIQSLLNQSKIEETKTCLEKFSYLTRSVLENSKKREVPLEMEIETLKLYMELENFRFRNPFTYEINVETGIDPKTTLIPPLILQPFVENSIKHGFRETEKPGHVKIELKNEQDQLICIIEDNGIGRKESMKTLPSSGYKRESIGMKLTEERLHLISEIKKRKSYFIIEDLENKLNKPIGTRIRMFLPFELSV